MKNPPAKAPSKFLSQMEAACQSASEWNNLLRWAREERGPYLDPSTLTYQINRNSASALNNVALSHQFQIPMKYNEFKHNQVNTVNLQGEFIFDNSEGMGLNEGRSPGLNYQASGRTTRSQTSMMNQGDQDSGSGFTGFSHATVANFKFQRGAGTLNPNASYALSPSRSANILSTEAALSNSPNSSQSVPYPRKGRPKRGNGD